MNNIKEPVVSIIIPTYNRPKTLKRAIDSCLSQTYKNIEILIIDDNNDGDENQIITEKLILDSYKNKKEVVYIKMHKNSGACKARNKGIEMSKGEYITFLDDDDEYLPNNIEKELEFIKKSNYDVVFCNYMFINDDTGKIIKYKYKKDFDNTRKSLLKKHLIDIISCTNAFFYKKNVLTEIGGFYEIKASQEYILMLKTIVADYNVGHFDFIGVKNHIQNQTKRITGSLNSLEAKKEVIKLIKPYLKELTLSDKRKVIFRLNSFLFINYLRKKNLQFIKYGLKVIPYIDLVIKHKIKKRENSGDVIFI